MAEYKPYVPGYDYQADLPTYQDAVEYVMDLFGIKRNRGRELRLAKQAVRTAYRNLALNTEWRYYYRRAALTTSASYSTGTVKYTHSTRTVTLSGGTWPSWAAYGRIEIDDAQYSVESRTSDTAIVLRQRSNPGVDVSAGTSYTMTRPYYALPNDFRKMVFLYDTEDSATIWIRDMASMNRFQVYDVSTPGTPLSASIGGVGSYYHNLAIELEPEPEEQRVYTFAYYAWPRPILIEKFGIGTVSVSSTTCTISAGTLPESCVGSVVRFSDSQTKEPTGPDGDSLGVDNLYSAARIITGRTSDTEFEVDSAPGDMSAKRYIISDPLHMSPTMFSAFETLSAFEYCSRVRAPKDRVVSRADVRRAIISAREAERMEMNDYASDVRHYFRNYDMEDYAT